MKRSDLPFGSEFSPSQIELARVLEMADEHGGDWHAFEDAVRATYFDNHKTTEYNRGKLANNTKLGMIAYGIIDREAALTEFGQELLLLTNDEPSLYERFAKHILLNLHGMTLVRCIQDMVAAGEVVTLTTLREGLAARGVHYPSGGKHPSMMRLWLAKAGVFVGSRWQVNPHRIEDILGLNPDEFEALADFTPEQRTFLRALANTGERDPQPANKIVKLATATYGIKFPEKSLPKMVLHSLVEAGYITADKTTTGRGAKPFQVAPTDKLIADVVEPLLEQLKGQTDPKLLALLRTPLSDILEEIKEKDRYKAGLALEALAFKIMRLLDMTYVATRLRANQTGGAEVDLVFESARLVFSRWQIQCKNTARVSLDDVAKEVGLTHFLKSNVIVMVTTGDIGNEARRYANRIMADSNLAIVMLDGGDLHNISDSPATVIRAFEREARHAMNLKKLDL
ncbi:restriction endonuclease [Denitrobaculum tricleocarpae]|uniref:Restriction endonuclease n=1 Tax=Denitrobaculum tricleocarpae TaxID=2591009 RepID=A0A545U0R3_9PROT|nr:restriction endonuclease [Denitrobaculum tricleocarpae]TQV83045.1 restriction endonuclease [Denitrobaculum tricleocarpae]